MKQLNFLILTFLTFGISLQIFGASKPLSPREFSRETLRATFLGYVIKHSEEVYNQEVQVRDQPQFESMEELEAYLTEVRETHPSAYKKKSKLISFRRSKHSRKSLVEKPSQFRVFYTPFKEKFVELGVFQKLLMKDSHWIEIKKLPEHCLMGEKLAFSAKDFSYGESINREGSPFVDAMNTLGIDAPVETRILLTEKYPIRLWHLDSFDYERGLETQENTIRFLTLCEDETAGTEFIRMPFFRYKLLEGYGLTEDQKLVFSQELKRLTESFLNDPAYQDLVGALSERTMVGQPYTSLANYFYHRSGVTREEGVKRVHLLLTPHTVTEEERLRRIQENVSVGGTSKVADDAELPTT